MSLITSAAIIYFVVAVSVIFHEFGHYSAAKRNGCEVSVFNVGIGPKLFGFTHRGTKISFKLIPLGGYIELECDHFDYEEKLAQGMSADDFNTMLRSDFHILFAGPLANLFLSVVSLIVMVALITAEILYTGTASGFLYSVAGVAFNSALVNFLGFIVNLIPMKGSDGSLLLKGIKAKRMLRRVASKELASA